MGRLERLLEELCPEGVEYKRLGDIASITRGGNFQKKDYQTTGVPCIHYGQIYTQYRLFATSTFSYVSPETAKKQKMAATNDIIMAVTSENVEDVCKCVAWLGHEPIAVSGHTAIIHHKQNAKYLAYYFNTLMFHEQKRKIAHGTKVIEVTPDKLKDIKVPVPPFPIQEEIVRILDSFSECTAQLSANLEKEFTVRKKQYEYYRDELLSFQKRDYHYTTFGAVALIVRGASPRPIKKFMTNDKNGVNWIKIGDVPPESKYITATKEKITKAGAGKSRYVKPGDFVLSNSMSFGRPYIIKIDGCIHDGWLSISEFNKTYSPDFLYHLLSSNAVQKAMAKRASSGTVQNLNADIVKSLELPIPPLEEQARIVSILDRFDALCNDLTSGLPAEIAARRKQYEYYRDKLLNFPEKRA